MKFTVLELNRLQHSECHCTRSIECHSNSHGIRRSRKGIGEVRCSTVYRTFFKFIFYIRYKQNLTEGKNVGIKKGLMLGITQAFVNIVLYGGISIIFWYGPLLIRQECQNYTAGHWMVVRSDELLFSLFRERLIYLSVDFHLLFNFDIFIDQRDSQYLSFC